jgi:hypothetical protein
MGVALDSGGSREGQKVESQKSKVEQDSRAASLDLRTFDL